MKRTLLTLVTLCLMAMTTWADEQRRVQLTSDHSQETVSMAFCNIFVKMTGDDGDNAQVSIELENLSETHVLLLFDRAYAEKAVKGMSPSIRFDKTFGGTKGRRVIDACSQQLNRVLQFRPSDKLELPQLTVANGATQIVKLPIYIAKWKGSRKLILLEKQVVELSIEAELRPSAEYLSLTDEVEKLERETLCPNAKHSPKLARQKENLQQKIDQQKEKIDQAIAAHGWTEADGGYVRYKALRDRLDAIDMDSHQRDCGRHAQTQQPECANCGLSLQQIYHRLDDIYKRVFNSSNRQATKQSVMGQVNLLYQCASSHRTHKTQWQRGGEYKTKITDRYNRIKGL